MSFAINGIMDHVRQTFVTTQESLDTVSRNIANATVDGYSRVDLQISPSTGEVISTRQHDALLDRAVRDYAGPSSGHAARASILDQVESVFGEPSENGLASSMDKFWGAWSDLANNPTDSVAKTAVQQRGLVLASTFNRYASQLSQLATSTRQAVVEGVTQVNELANQLAQVNSALGGARDNDGQSSTLLDARDRLIDQIAQYSQVTITDAPDGSKSIYINSNELVRGTHVSPLKVESGPPLGVSLRGSIVGDTDLGGKIGALLQGFNTDIAKASSGLDALASALVRDINAVHTTGWSPSASGGSTGVAFFSTSPAGLTAGKIALSSEVAGNADRIATGTTIGARGDNTLALSLAGMRDYSPSAAGNSFGAAYQTLVAETASSRNSVDADAAVFKTLYDQAKTKRQSANGVSTDEELVKMLRYQQSYAAASKIVQAVDQMMQTLMATKS